MSSAKETHCTEGSDLHSVVNLKDKQWTTKKQQEDPASTHQRWVGSFSDLGMQMHLCFLATTAFTTMREI